MSVDLRLTQLIERYFDGVLQQDEAAELGQELLDSASARAEFWEFAKLHNLLHEAEKLNAGSSAALRVINVGECTIEAPDLLAPRQFAWQKWAFTAAALLLLGVSIYLGAGVLLQDKPAQGDTVYVAQLRHSDNAEWAPTGAQLNDGDHIARGPLELESGVAELVFFNGAAVAIEGPAKIELLSTSRMILHRGNLSADVPHKAIGFTVETPDSKVIDLGTRFGVKVDPKGVTETHVFEGKVTVESSQKIKNAPKRQNVTQDNSLRIDQKKKSVTPGKADISRFPTPERVISLPLIDGGFEDGTVVGTSGIAAMPGVWSGDYCSVVGPEQDVTPRSGKGMLKFQLTFGSGSLENTRAQLMSSDQFQIVDLKAFIPEIERGGCSVEASGWFRCAVGNPESNNRFGIGVYSFHGTPEEARDLWARKNAEALCGSLKEIPAEQVEKRWSNVRTSTQLPKNSTLLLIHIFAKHIMASSDASEEFPGHYADSIELKLSVAPQSGKQK